MALVKCPVCGTLASTKGDVCPVCGKPVSEILDELNRDDEVPATESTPEPVSIPTPLFHSYFPAPQPEPQPEPLSESLPEPLSLPELEEMEPQPDSQPKHQTNTDRPRKGLAPILLGILGVIALALSVALTITVRKSHDRQESINQLRREVSRVKNELSKTKNSLSQAQSEHRDFVSKVSDAYPLIINKVEISNKYMDGSIRDDFGSIIYSSNTMFLGPRITYDGLKIGNITLNVKFFRPNGELATGSSSPSGYSYSVERSIKEGDGQVEYLSSWGNDNPGLYWGRGYHRIEIWYGHVCLYTKSFYIY